MSFGWSFGDVISGIKVVWDIYDAISDGPLNAQLEATQFFEEFSQIIQCLDRWERKAQSDQDETLSNLHQQLREQCEKFIKRHILLIQGVNPRTEAVRDGRSTWLRKAAFSREQVVLLYRRVQWPLERKEVARLRKKLIMFLQVSTHNAVIDTNEKMRDIWTLQQSNLKLVASHLEVVSSIKQNLRMVTGPRDLGQLDYPMLRQFEHAILPPPPIKAIEARPADASLPFPFPQRQIEDNRYIPVSSSLSSTQEVGLLGQNENLLKERLDNITKRGMGTRGELLPVAEQTRRRYSVVQPVLERLREIRTGFGDAVGLSLEAIPEGHMSSAIVDAQGALKEELELWNQLEERIQYDVKRREQLLNRDQLLNRVSTISSASATIPSPNMTPILESRTSEPIPIPVQSQRISPNLSPMSSPLLGVSPSSEDWFGSPDSGRFHRNSSASSTSGAPSICLENPLPVVLQHQTRTYHGSINSYVQEDGEVYMITIVSEDGLTELRHLIDRSPSAPKETSMKPFLDNHHIDKTHKFRAQFHGGHILKITKRDNQGTHKSEKRGQHIQHNPVYKFHNEKDYLKFQSLLLGKEIVLCVDVELISSAKDPQCRLGTIRILVEPIYEGRSILYFRSKTKDNLHPSFVEWPTILFKEPKQPASKCKTLMLESFDGKSLSLSRTALSRRSTQGSVTTIGSFESSAAGFARLQERPSGKNIKSLVIEFHEANDCHRFWKEFIKRDDISA